jgi:hypothetical protein
MALIGSRKDEEGDLHRLAQVQNAEIHRFEFSNRTQFLNRDMRLTSNERPVGSIVEPTEPIPITKHPRLQWFTRGTLYATFDRKMHTSLPSYYV